MAQNIVPAFRSDSYPINLTTVVTEVEAAAVVVAVAAVEAAVVVVVVAEVAEAEVAEVEAEVAAVIAGGRCW